MTAALADIRNIQPSLERALELGFYVRRIRSATLRQPNG